MKAVELISVPKELLIIIFSYLYQSHLALLCYNKALSAVAQNLLYRRYYGNNHNIFYFLRTILTNSTLALQVRHVYLDELHTAGEFTPDEYTSLFTAAIHKFPTCESNKRRWIQCIMKGHKEALATLVLAYLPNLRTLEIWTQDQYALEQYGAAQFLLQGKPFWTLLMPDPVATTVRMPLLDKVITLNLLSLPCSVLDLARVFALPALRSLHTWDVVDIIHPEKLPDWAFRPYSNAISTLALTSASLSLGTLRRMLLSCSELESFAYNCPTRHTNLNLDHLLDIVQTSYKTLKSLTLLDLDALSLENTEVQPLTQLTSLQQFSGDTTILTGQLKGCNLFEMLPGSLCQLHLRDVPSSVIDSLGGAEGILHRLSRPGSVLPRLDKVSLVRSLTFSDEDFTLAFYDQNGLELCIQGKMAYDFE